MNERQNGEIPNVEDPGEYNQRRRLKEFADMERHARRSLMEAQSSISPPEADAPPERVAFGAVRMYAQQLLWHILDHGGDEYFTEELGVIDVEPPGKLTALADPRTRPKDVGIHGSVNVDTREYPIVGLVPPKGRDVQRPPNASAFLELPNVASASWEVEINRKHQRPKPETFEATREIPLNITSKAFDLCTKFVHESGLDARIEEEVKRDPNPV